MSPRLPELIEPERMAETGRVLEGSLSLSKLKRLAPLLFTEEVLDQAPGEISREQGGEDDQSGEVVVKLVFGADAAGQLNVTGSFETDVKLQCQRCMQALDLHIAEKISLAIVYSNEQADELPSHYEPLVLSDEEELVSLPELIEDEILLALPSVPLHDPDECQLEETASVTGEAGQNQALNQSEPQQKSPFAVLEKLRNKD